MSKKRKGIDIDEIAKMLKSTAKESHKAIAVCVYPFKNLPVFSFENGKLYLKKSVETEENKATANKT